MGDFDLDTIMFCIFLGMVYVQRAEKQNSDKNELFSQTTAKVRNAK